MSDESFVFSSNVKVLTDANFESEVLRASVPVFVLFYAPWNAYCKSFAPTFDSTADSYGPESENAGKIIFGALNGDENRESLDVYSVNGYPDVRIFMNGDCRARYSGSRYSYGLPDYCTHFLEKLSSGISPFGA